MWCTCTLDYTFLGSSATSTFLMEVGDLPAVRTPCISNNIWVSFMLSLPLLLSISLCLPPLPSLPLSHSHPPHPLTTSLSLSLSLAQLTWMLWSLSLPLDVFLRRLLLLRGASLLLFGAPGTLNREGVARATGGGVVSSCDVPSLFWLVDVAWDFSMVALTIRGWMTCKRAKVT